MNRLHRNILKKNKWNLGISSYNWSSRWWLMNKLISFYLLWIHFNHMKFFLAYN